MMENGGVGGRRENPHKCEQGDGYWLFLTRPAIQVPAVQAHPPPASCLFGLRLSRVAASGYKLLSPTVVEQTPCFQAPSFSTSLQTAPSQCGRCLRTPVTTWAGCWWLLAERSSLRGRESRSTAASSLETSSPTRAGAWSVPLSPDVFLLSGPPSLSWTPTTLSPLPHSPTTSTCLWWSWCRHRWNTSSLWSLWNGGLLDKYTWMNENLRIRKYGMPRYRTSQPRSKSKVTKAAFSLSSSTHRCRVTLSLPINSCRRTTTPRQKLITFALHSAFCFVTNIVDVPLHLWEKCLAYVQRFIAEASRLLTRCRGVGDQLRNFLNTSSISLAIFLMKPIYVNCRSLLPEFPGGRLPPFASLPLHFLWCSPQDTQVCANHQCIKLN